MAMMPVSMLEIMAGVFIGVVLVLLYGICIERYLVRFPRYRIRVPNLPQAFGGFTVVHISDLHYGPLVPHWFLKRLLKRVDNLEKDIIVCTGDFVLGKEVPSRVDVAWSLLRGLSAQQGVYSVLGNCDHRADSERSLRRMVESGQDLRGKAVEVRKGEDSLWIAGAGDLMEDHIPLDEFLGGIPEEACRIVLAHNPDSADTAFAERMDLMIAGHTHGGQVNLPFIGIPMLPVENKTYSFGLKRSLKNELVFISKGIGWGVFPGRLNCLPEIPILELVPATSGARPAVRCGGSDGG
jgi:predicted MPP superfamily phosphohydrolase